MSDAPDVIWMDPLALQRAKDDEYGQWRDVSTVEVTGHPEYRLARSLAADTVTCEDCGFRYGAEHENEGGGYSCPNCAEAALRARVEELERVSNSVAVCARHTDEITAQDPSCWVCEAVEAGEVADTLRTQLREAKETALRVVGESLWILNDNRHELLKEMTDALDRVRGAE